VKIDAPAGTVISADGTVTIPDGKAAEVALSGGANVTVPGGTTIAPDGTVTVGGGTADISLSGGVAISVPSGSTISSDGRVTIGSGGGQITLSGGFTIGLEEDSIIILDANTPLGYFISFDNPYTDVKESDWFYDDVAFVYTHGLFEGTSATTFSPYMEMSRGMVVTVLARLSSADLSKYTESGFTDVEADKYYAESVEWAKENSIVTGTGDGLFSPDTDISRQDLAVILYRYAEVAGVALPSVKAQSDFADNSAIAGYAAEAVYAMQRAGIIGGKPGKLFDPNGTATRAEVAAMLHRFLVVIGSESIASEINANPLTDGGLPDRAMPPQEISAILSSARKDDDSEP
jgi:hypothetical protein